MATDCCTPCTEPVAVAIPGPKGDAGAAAADGAAGVNAFTVTTASFVMPAEGGDVSVDVVNSTWMTPTQKVYVQNAGYMEVRSKATATEVTLRNIEDTAAAEYLENVAPATVIASGSQISPAGIQGPGGTAAAGVLLAANDLSDVASAATSRTNLGLTATAIATPGTADGNVAPVDDAAGLTVGEALFATATGIESQAAATARTSLGLAIGTNVQAWDALLDAIAALVTSADTMIYATGADAFAQTALTPFARTVLDDTTAVAARTTLGAGIDNTSGSVTGAGTNYVLTGVIQLVNFGTTDPETPSLAAGTYLVLGELTVELATGGDHEVSYVLNAPSGGGDVSVLGQFFADAPTVTRNVTLTSVALVTLPVAGTIQLQAGQGGGGSGTATALSTQTRISWVKLTD